MKQMVFIVTTLDAHVRHRVDDFVAHGFDVHVHAFTRSNEKQTAAAAWPLDVIGSFPNSMPYRKRLAILYRGIKQVASTYKNRQNVCFYYIGLDIAMIATVVVRQPYIYEECDLNHTYIGNAVLRRAFELLDRRIIGRSFRTVLTSEGFLDYHRLKNADNIVMIPNRLPESIQTLPQRVARQTDVEHLSFGFAGSVRYETITSFADILLRNFPQHAFHFFGNVQENVGRQCKDLERYPNCHFHGPFASPVDLPAIYSQLDFTVATYDTRYENVRYAEPNKIYEAIYFRTPIIVSKGTFLAEKTLRMKLGFAVDAMDEADVVSFVQRLTADCVAGVRSDISAISRDEAIDDNTSFYEDLRQMK